MKYYVGIDLGGTFIKGGLVDKKGNIVRFERVPTRSAEGADAVIIDMKAMIERLTVGLEEGAVVAGIGMGVPGLVSADGRSVLYAPNLKWNNVHVAEKLKERFDVPIRLSNDANCAGLGEATFGAGKKYKSSVFLTLGTGVGGAIIIDGKLFEGNGNAGAEIGHMILHMHGRKCGCGSRGCFETYASASALVSDTRAAMEKHKESKMWSVGSLECVNGKTSFDFYSEDATAKSVVDKYVDHLSAGIISIVNVFRPQAVILGGGVAKQGAFLTDKVKVKVAKKSFAPKYAPKVEILSASLEEAGVVGAASLNMKK